MRIGFVGAGRVGYTLSRYLNDNFHNVCGIYSKSLEDSMDCARFCRSEYYKNLINLINDCDTLFLTVNDNAISDVVDELIKLGVRDKILIHTSGSQSSAAFKMLVHDNYCYSLHPIYAFNSKYTSFEEFNEAYLTLEGDKGREGEIKALFKDKVVSIVKDNKELYHAGCVMISNLVCALFNNAEDIFNRIGIDNVEIFKPLILNNIKNILDNGSIKALTGPIIRNDFTTVKKHLASLNENDLKTYIPLSLKLCDMSEIINKIDYNPMRDLLKGADVK